MSKQVSIYSVGEETAYQYGDSRTLVSMSPTDAALLRSVQRRGVKPEVMRARADRYREFAAAATTKVWREKWERSAALADFLAFNLEKDTTK